MLEEDCLDTFAPQRQSYCPIQGKASDVDQLFDDWYH
jgi:hypothetical protein